MQVKDKLKGLKQRAPVASPAKSILIAEDDRINTLILKKLLSPLGLNLSFAEDGCQAVELYRQQHFDLVLMDLYMPRMDGVEASIAIRKMSPGTPIIAISAALVDPEDLKRTAGIEYFLPKPVDIQDFKHLLTKLIK